MNAYFTTLPNTSIQFSSSPYTNATQLVPSGQGVWHFNINGTVSSFKGDFDKCKAFAVTQCPASSQLTVVASNPTMNAFVFPVG